MKFMKKSMLVLALCLVTLISTTLSAAGFIPHEENDNIIGRLKSEPNFAPTNIDAFLNKHIKTFIVDGVDKTGQIPKEQMPIITDKGTMYMPATLFQTIMPETCVDYDAASKILRVNYKEKWLYTIIGKQTAYTARIGGFISTYFKSNNMPTLSGGKVYLPLKYAIEELGCKMAWDNKTSTIAISTNGQIAVIPNKPNAAASKTPTLYLCQKPFKIGAKDKVSEDYVDVNNGLITVKCTKSLKSYKDNDTGMYFVGSISLYQDEQNTSPDSFKKQSKEVTRVLETFLTKEQAAAIMKAVSAHWKERFEPSMQEFKFGDYLIKDYPSRNMVRHESLLIYMK